MDTTEAYINKLLAPVKVREVEVGKRLSRTHSEYHDSLHDPMLRLSPRWCQLAFLNYTVFFGLGVCVRVLQELRTLDASINVHPHDIHRRLMRPATIDAFTARLGASLDALAASAFGIISTADPITQTTIYFGSFLDPASRYYATHTKTFRTGATGTYYVTRLTRQFNSARRELQEFVYYRNKIVHTVLLPRREAHGQQYLARITNLFPGRHGGLAEFVRVYSLTNPVYLTSTPPARPQRALDFQRRPVAAQLERYHALAIKHAGTITKTIRRGYLDMIQRGILNGTIT